MTARLWTTPLCHRTFGEGEEEVSEERAPTHTTEKSNENEEKKMLTKVKIGCQKRVRGC